MRTKSGRSPSTASVASLRRLTIFSGAMLSLLGAACSSADVEESEELGVEGTPGILRVVEVLRKGDHPFIELRNDGDKEERGSENALRISSSTEKLTPLFGFPDSVSGHGLALVVDAAEDQEWVKSVACEAPIQTTRSALGSAHAGQEDILAGTLELIAKRPACRPVFAIKDLAKTLGSAATFAVVKGTKEVDKIGVSGEPQENISFERKGPAKFKTQFVLSPIGSTPMARNFYSSDENEGSGGKPPLLAYTNSPWRVGEALLAGESEESTHSNPLAPVLIDYARLAKKDLSGSFYQLNDESIVDALVDFKKNGVGVRIQTDAEFREHEKYTPGWEKFRNVGIPVVFDANDSNQNRGALSHNKYLLIDDEWIFTGSYNPLGHEPARVHTDNALGIRSRALNNINRQDFEQLFRGEFGTAKRKGGIGGGEAFVDGAYVSLRFSPGMTDTQLKARSKKMVETKDPAQACNVKNSSGASILDERYRNIFPCGGPVDMIYSEVARATSSVYLAQFAIGLPDLKDVLNERMKAGVEVKGIVDATVITDAIPKALSDAGADMRYTPNSDPPCPAYITPKKNCPTNPNKVWLHHKFMIVDYGTAHASVITGSHNMSTGAEQNNDETLIVVRDRAIVETYYRAFREAFEHPQSLGTQMTTPDLPALAITSVEPSVTTQKSGKIEIKNFGDKPADVASLLLWNRKSAPISLGSGTIGPGRSMTITIENKDGIFFSPTTALAVLTKKKETIATYDPITAAQNLNGQPEPVIGKPMVNTTINDGTISNTVRELLGVNTGSATAPVWSPRGLYSDWGGEFNVTPAGVLMMKAARSSWKR